MSDVLACVTIVMVEITCLGFAKGVRCRKRFGNTLQQTMAKSLDPQIEIIPAHVSSNWHQESFQT